jgi:hypothetical protein
MKFQMQRLQKGLSYYIILFSVVLSDSEEPLRLSSRPFAIAQGITIGCFKTKEESI